MAFAIERLSLQRVLLAQMLHKQHYQQIRVPSMKAIHTATQLNSLKSWYQRQWLPRKTEPPYSHLTQVGDPVLRRKAAPVPLDAIKSKELNLFLDQMVDVLHSYKLVGMAAPQIGIGLRIIVMEFPDRLRDEFTAEEYKIRAMQTLPLTIMLNPELTVTDYSKNIFVEACGSIRGYSAEVSRYEAVTLTGLSRDGEKQVLQLNGWNARIAQHEMDHLNGIVFTDIMNRQSFSCSCWHMVNVKEGRLNIPFGPK